MFTKDNTNTIKGIAILLMVFHHMYLTVYDIAYSGIKLYFISPEQLSKFAFCCRICVFIFAFLSAYGLSLIYPKFGKDSSSASRVLRFCSSRYLKLLSPYWFTWIILFVILLLFPYSDVWSSFSEHPVKLILEDLLCVLDFKGDISSSLIGQSWYLSFAILEVLLIPLLYKLIDRFGFSIIIFTSVLFNWIPDAFVSEYGGNYNQYIYICELGVLFARFGLFEKIKNGYSKLKITFKIIVGTGLVILTWICPYCSWFVFESNLFGIQSLGFTIGSLALILFSFLFLNNNIIGKGLAFIGRYSADMYLLHIAIYSDIFFGFIYATDNIFVQYLSCIIITFAMAFIIGMAKKYSGYNILFKKITSAIETLGRKEKQSV